MKIINFLPPAEADQFMPHIDEVIEPLAKQILLIILLRF